MYKAQFSHYVQLIHIECIMVLGLSQNYVSTMLFRFVFAKQRYGRLQASD